MDKTFEAIFRVFNHLAREIQLYFFSGFLVLLNIYVIDFFYYDQSLFKVVGRNEFIVPGIILGYVIGHICMAYFYVLFELTKFGKKIDKILGFDYSLDTSDLPSIYKENKEVYIHFIERYAILTLMRWTLSAAFLLNFFIDILFLTICKYYWQVCLLTVLNFLASVVMYILTSKTEKDYSDRIESIKKQR